VVWRKPDWYESWLTVLINSHLLTTGFADNTLKMLTGGVSSTAAMGKGKKAKRKQDCTEPFMLIQRTGVTEDQFK
jgi:hypothetical protein